MNARISTWLSISILIGSTLMFSTVFAQPGDGDGSGDAVVEGSGDAADDGSGDAVVEDGGDAVAVPAAYVEACNRCHNDDGSPTRVGERLGSADLTGEEAAALTADEIRAAIVDGREGMPPAELEAAALDEIVAFVDALTP